MTTITLVQAIAKLNDRSGQSQANPLVTADPIEILENVSTTIEGLSVAVANATQENMEAFVASVAGPSAVCIILDSLSHAIEVAREIVSDRQAAAGARS